MRTAGLDAAQRRRFAPILRALSDPRTYPDADGPVEVAETHISWVFLAGSFAYKLKKPLVLSFLDYGTPARRRRMCREEVRLNSRLAPDVYLDVVSIAAGPHGLALAREDDPDAIERLVRMRRYDERDTLASRLAARPPGAAEIGAVARTLARFHAAAQPASPRAGGVSATRARVRRNVAELLEVAPSVADAARTRALARSLQALLARRAHALDARAAAGMVRDGHGDLRAEHVLLSNPPQVVDCVEFDPALRRLDVAEDISFLVMDLTALGGSEHVPVLLAAYRAAGGDPGDDALLALFGCHRALVRAKVAFTRAAQQSGAQRVGSRELARSLLDVAERFAWRARMPLTVVVCGLPGSGKSTLAERVGRESGLPVLDSDRTRKRLAGLAAGERGGPEIYSADRSRRTYEELGRLAAVAVREQGGAIVDGTFRRRADREAFARSFAAASPLLFVRCLAPRGLRVRRAAAREQDGDSPSDATAALVAGETFVWEDADVQGLDAPPLLTLATDRSVASQAADLRARLDR